MSEYQGSARDHDQTAGVSAQERMHVLTVDEFHKALRAQGVEQDDLAFMCPMCRTVQSARSLINASAGEDFDAVERYLGFSCVGRWTGGKSPRRKPDGKPCDWSLGGFFPLHKLEVETPDGKRHPRFEVASPEEAQALAAQAAKATVQ